MKAATKTQTSNPGKGETMNQTSADEYICKIRAEQELFESTNYRGGYLISELRAAFEEISDPEDYKGPIDAVIPASKFDLYKNAVIFFTATDFHMVRPVDSERVRVMSVGYRVGPAGDH